MRLPGITMKPQQYSIKEEVKDSWQLLQSIEFRWKLRLLTVQTMHRFRIKLEQHTQSSNVTTVTQCQKTLLIMAKHGDLTHLAFKTQKVTDSSLFPHKRTTIKDLEYECIITTKQHNGVHKYKFHQPKNLNSPWDSMCAYCQTSCQDDVEVGTSTNGIPRQDEVTMGRVHSQFCILSQLTP